MERILLLLWMGLLVEYGWKDGLQFVIKRCTVLLPLPVIIQFAVQIIFGAIIYVGISYVFKVESFEYILSIVKKKIK